MKCRQLLKETLLSLIKKYPQKYYFVNMKAKEHNTVVYLLSKLLNIKLNLIDLYINEFTTFKPNLVTNYGKKDIIINNQPLNLFHISETTKQNIILPKDFIIMQTSKHILSPIYTKATLAFYGFNQTPWIESYDL